MTEQDWRICTDSQKMFEFLRDKATERKRRLFAVACCCRAIRRSTSPTSTFLSTAEGWVCGQVDGVELRQALDASQAPLLLSLAMLGGSTSEVAEWAVQEAIGFAYSAGLSPKVVELQDTLDCCLPDFDQPCYHAAAQEERDAQSSHLRDLFGSLPFRPVAVDPSWVAWNQGTLRKLAQGIDEENAFDRLPILADGLEDAGCDDTDILEHCRGPGPHSAGCWVLDLLMGRPWRYAMNERAWLACQDIGELLSYLIGRVSDRKFRLFGCACCRRIWHLLIDGRSTKAVSVAEQYADRLATEAELDAARREMVRCVTENALRAGSPPVNSWAFGAAHSVLFETPHWNPAAGCDGAVVAASEAAEAAWRGNGERGPEPEASRQLPLLRDIFENPYRPGWVDPAWLSRQVLAVAETIYRDQTFGDLPILADALEDAGCDNADILVHLRSPNPHVRGCWALDLILGKQ